MLISLLLLLLLGSSTARTGTTARTATARTATGTTATGTAGTATLRQRNRQTAAKSSDSDGSSSSSTLYQPSGLQSGPDQTGSSFATSMVYHSEDHTVTVVGSTFGTFFSKDAEWQETPGEVSACFIATASLPPPFVTAGTAGTTGTAGTSGTSGTSGGSTDDHYQMEWLNVQIIRESVSAVTESCNSLLQHRGRLYATGYTEKGGVLDPLRNAGSLVNTKQFGMILDMEFSNSTDRTAAVKLHGGRVLQESPVVYPVALTTSPSDDFVYVVTMETSDASKNTLTTNSVTFTGSTGNDHITLHGDPTRFFTYGSSFGMSIERLELTSSSGSAGTGTGTDPSGASLHKTLSENWRQMYVTNGGESVHVADIAKLSDDVLIVVGSTAGYGPAFRPGPETGSDMDGFVTKLRTDAGTPYRDWSAPDINPSTTRVQSVNGQDDWVMGVCHDLKDPAHFYLVGATQGQLGAAVAGSTANPSTEAFLMKMETSSLKPVWTTQIGADTSTENSTVVHGGSCAVTSDGATVYMGGIVKDDAVLDGSGAETSFGFDDIFVVQMNSQDGRVQWVRQIGTDGDDEFARSGIHTDSAGNAIVLGNTVGSLYRTKSEEEQPPNSDVFLMTISRYNGDFQRLDGEVKAFDPPSVPASAPSPAPTTPNSVKANNAASDDGDDRNTTKYASMLAFLLASIAAITLAAVYVGRRMPREVNTDRSEVLGYLSHFDVEDIDLKHSATGGWHCNYANSLAEGVNTGPASTDGGFMAGGNNDNDNNNDVSTNGDFAPLNAAASKSNSKNSNLLADSLFMDDDEPVMLGGLDGSGGSGRTSGYGGLANAYNNNSSSFDEQSGSRSNQSRRKTDTWGREIV
jgi:hypothetical protein